jgi:hypothetical protein
MVLSDIRDALLTVGCPVFHFESEGDNDKYIVWAEDSEGDTPYADNQPTNTVLEGTVDYFTKEEYDTNKDKVVKSLRGIGCSCRLNSIQHENDTEYIHYEWVWQAIING